MTTDTPVGRLEAGDATAGSRDAYRATGIGANGAQAHSHRHSNSRAPAGAAGDALVIPGIARRRSIGSVGKFMGIGFAYDNSPFFAQLLDHHRIFLRDIICQHLRACRCTHTLDSDNVFHPDGDAMQRATIEAGAQFAL